MSRWRSKMLFSLILYCAGFATAVYVLVPLPDTASAHTTVRASQKGPSAAAPAAPLYPQAWAVTMRVWMDEAVCFARKAAIAGFRALAGRSDNLPAAGKPSDAR